MLVTFRGKVTFVLLDQVEQKRNLADSFQPHPSSFSFQLPRRERNVAFGCPLFVSHAELEAEDSVFLQDDTVFIKVVVDTFGLQRGDDTPAELS